MIRLAESGVVQQPAVSEPDAGTRRDDSEEWLASLRAAGPEREAAIGRLHGLLLRAARFESARRRATLGIGAQELDDLAVQAADDALMAVVARLDTFRGVVKVPNLGDPPLAAPARAHRPRLGMSVCASTGPGRPSSL